MKQPKNISKSKAQYNYKFVAIFAFALLALIAFINAPKSAPPPETTFTSAKPATTEIIVIQKNDNSTEKPVPDLAVDKVSETIVEEPAKPTLADALPESAVAPAPIVKDDAYRQKLWATLPKPIIKDFPPLPTISADEKRNLRRKIIEYVTNKSNVKSIPVPEYKKGEPAKYWYCDKQYDENKDNKPKIYFLIGQHLKLAGVMFADSDAEVATSGIGITSRVISCCMRRMHDYELAASVADAYLLPELNHADQNILSHLSEQHLMSTASYAYSKVKRPDVKIQICGRAIKLIGSDRNVSDVWRLKLSEAYLEEGNQELAIAVLNDIHDPSIIGARDYELDQISKKKKENPLKDIGAK